MDELIENANLNINLWLINWGYMNGYLQDGQIQITKFDFIYQWICITTSFINFLRSTILLLNAKESIISNQLGDWSYFFGPRVLILLLTISVSTFIYFVIILFKFCSRNPKKMLYWLNTMKYDVDNECFPKMKLNQFDSNVFIKRMLLFINTLKFFTFAFMFCFMFVILISIYKYLDDYHLNQLVSVMLFVPAFYYYINYAFGLPVILYLVSILVTSLMSIRN